MLRCKEVVRRVASDELARSGWMRRLAVRMHLLMCRHCRRYTMQIRSLGTIARGIWGAGAEDSASLRRLEGVVAARIGSLDHPPADSPEHGGDTPH